MSVFISFEGPDGSGKSTQAHMLAQALRQRGERVTETREPGGTPLGERVRELWLQSVAADASPLTMVFLLSAARAEHVQKVIRPALAAGEIVITDRFADSTLAYQSYGLGVDQDDVRTITEMATGHLTPDISVYVDVDPETGISRLAGRGQKDWLDSRALAFHEAVRSGYREIIRQEPARWICVDGSAAPEVVHDAILRQLDPMLKAARKPA